MVLSRSRLAQIGVAVLGGLTSWLLTEFLGFWRGLAIFLILGYVALTAIIGREELSRRKFSKKVRGLAQALCPHENVVFVDDGAGTSAGASRLICSICELEFDLRTSELADPKEVEL